MTTQGILNLNIAEGLIYSVAPELVGKGIPERIKELELEDTKSYKSFTTIALKIVDEITREKFCKFETQKKALDAGLKFGLIYSSFLEVFLSNNGS